MANEARTEPWTVKAHRRPAFPFAGPRVSGGHIFAPTTAPHLPNRSSHQTSQGPHLSHFSLPTLYFLPLYHFVSQEGFNSVPENMSRAQGFLGALHARRLGDRKKNDLSTLLRPALAVALSVIVKVSPSPVTAAIATMLITMPLSISHRVNMGSAMGCRQPALKRRQ